MCKFSNFDLPGGLRVSKTPTAHLTENGPRLRILCSLGNIWASIKPQMTYLLLGFPLKDQNHSSASRYHLFHVTLPYVLVSPSTHIGLGIA